MECGLGSLHSQPLVTVIEHHYHEVSGDTSNTSQTNSSQDLKNSYTQGLRKEIGIKIYQSGELQVLKCQTGNKYLLI
jgi:hypothetical protein